MVNNILNYKLELNNLYIIIGKGFMKKIIFAVLAIISFVNLSAQNFSTKQGGNCYSLDIPNYMTKSFSLNGAASLQYQNSTKEAYIIVIEDAKDHLESLGMKYLNAKEFLEDFNNDFEPEATDRKLGKITEFSHNNNGYAQAELTWNDKNIDFYMLVTIVESKTHFYKILCWTLATNKDKLKDDFLKVAKSFKD